jgi:hypothetical protein
MLLNKYEIEFMFRIIRNIRNLGNVHPDVHVRGPHIVMSRTDAQNGFDFHFKLTDPRELKLNRLDTTGP